MTKLDKKWKRKIFFGIFLLILIFWYQNAKDKQINALQKLLKGSPKEYITATLEYQNLEERRQDILLFSSIALVLVTWWYSVLTSRLVKNVQQQTSNEVRRQEANIVNDVIKYMIKFENCLDNVLEELENINKIDHNTPQYKDSIVNIHKKLNTMADDQFVPEGKYLSFQLDRLNERKAYLEKFQTYLIVIRDLLTIVASGDIVSERFKNLQEHYKNCQIDFHLFCTGQTRINKYEDSGDTRHNSARK